MGKAVLGLVMLGGSSLGIWNWKLTRLPCLIRWLGDSRIIVGLWKEYCGGASGRLIWLMNCLRVLV